MIIKNNRAVLDFTPPLSSQELFIDYVPTTPSNHIDRFCSWWSVSKLFRSFKSALIATIIESIHPAAGHSLIFSFLTFPKLEPFPESNCDIMCLKWNNFSLSTLCFESEFWVDLFYGQFVCLLSCPDSGIFSNIKIQKHQYPFSKSKFSFIESHKKYRGLHDSETSIRLSHLAI